MTEGWTVEICLRSDKKQVKNWGGTRITPKKHEKKFFRGYRNQPCRTPPITRRTNPLSDSRLKALLIAALAEWILLRR